MRWCKWVKNKRVPVTRGVCTGEKKGAKTTFLRRRNSESLDEEASAKVLHLPREHFSENTPRICGAKTG